MAHLTPLFIGGEAKLSVVTFDVINPASGLVVGKSVNASREDCQAAVDDAARAFQTWEHSTIAERRNILLKAAELVVTDKYKNKILEAIQTETAASTAWCTYNLTATTNNLRTSIGFLGELNGQILPSIIPGGKLEVHRRAIGVMYVCFLLVHAYFPSL